MQGDCRFDVSYLGKLRIRQPETCKARLADTHLCRDGHRVTYLSLFDVSHRLLLLSERRTFPQPAGLAVIDELLVDDRTVFSK